MKKTFTIQDLAEGKCAVINDGTLDQLREVISLAFPMCVYVVNGGAPFYKKYEVKRGCWVGSSYPDLPSQSVKDFLPVDKFKELKEAYSLGAIIQFKSKKRPFAWLDVYDNMPGWFDEYEYRVKPSEEWQPKRGEVVLVKRTPRSLWVPRIYVGTIQGAKIPIIAVRTSYEEAFKEGNPYDISIYSEMKQKPQEIEVTREEIAAWKGISIEQLIIKD